MSTGKAGAKSDLTVFEATLLTPHPTSKLRAAVGQHPGAKLHNSRSKLPHKKPKADKLIKRQKRRLRKKRVKVEHVMRKCKCFRVVRETYYNHRKYTTQVWLIICGLVNCST